MVASIRKTSVNSVCFRERVGANPFSKWLNMAALVVCIATVLPVAAQEDEGDLFALSLRELSQIRVSIASRVEETFIDAPSSVTVITRQEINRLGVRTLSELLNYVPGFQSFLSPHESNGSLIMARGLARTYGANLLLMIDGRRLNDEYTGGFTWADHLLSLHNVKQVEVIRGPGSALYGSNAFSGVINIITEKREYFALTAGSNNGSGAAAAALGQVGELGVSAAFNFYRDDGQTYTGVTDKNGFNKTTLDPVEVFEGRLDLEHRQSRVILEYMATRLEDYFVLKRISNGANKNDSERLGVYVEHDFNLPQDWHGSGRLGFMRHDRNTQTFITPADISPFFMDWQQDTREAQFDLSTMTQAGHQLSLGAYLGYMDIPHSIITGLNPFVLEESRLVVGAYIQDQFDLQDDLRLTAGLRYDSYSDFGDTVNPRLALLYHWREHQSFKFIYGQAYRAPSLGDLYDKENIVSTGNLFLKPITVDTYEIAYLFSRGDNHFILTWFYNDYKDFISARTVPSGVILDNIYGNHTQGLELEIRWHINEHWMTGVGLTNILSNTSDIGANASFSRPEELAPKTYGNFQLNYKQNLWNWNVAVIFRDAIQALQDQNAVAIVNTKIIYRIDKHWEAGFNSRNLLDKRYSTPQNSAVGVDQFGNSIQEFPSREREFMLTLSYTMDN